MKIRVKAPFFDAKGIHKKGEIYETDNFNPDYMEIAEEKKETKVEKAVKADPKKTTRKAKKG